MASMKAKWYTKNMKSNMKLVEFKNWGPPYYKFKKTF